MEPASPLSPAERHEPVLLQRCLDLLSPALQEPGAIFVDCTLGMGGHTAAVLEVCPQARAIGIDRDPQALALASQRLEPFGSRFTPVAAVFDELPQVLNSIGTGQVQAILMDLGVSSLQLDEAERGFAYAQDAPLDMRMDQSGGITAAEILNTYSEQQLTRILREYGEERFAGKIARSIVQRRASQPWERSAPLVDLVKACIPAATRRGAGNPAKRTFQALRIEVNQELEVLERALANAIAALELDGRIVIESYHSLEDRLVKRAFAQGATSRSPLGLPVELEADQAYLELLTRGAEQANEAEIASNPRSASVRLRAAQRIRTSPAQEIL